MHDEALRLVAYIQQLANKFRITEKESSEEHIGAMIVDIVLQTGHRWIAQVEPRVNYVKEQQQTNTVTGFLDFFHPRLGFLVLEVKGGSIRCDGTEGLWYQNDHLLSMSPFRQAELSKYKLRQFLSDRLGYKLSGVRFAHV